MIARLGAGVLSTALSAWIRQFGTLVLYVAVARMLPAEDLGVFAFATSLLLLVEYAIHDALSETMVQRARLERGQVAAAILLGLGAALIVALGSLALAAPLASVLAMPGLVVILPSMGFGSALICAAAPQAGRLRRAGRLHYLAGLSAAAAACSITLALALLWIGFGLDALVAYFALEKALVAAGYVFGAGRLKWRAPSGRDALVLLPFMLSLAGQRAVFFLRAQIDRIVVGILWGPSVLGAYQLAAKIFESVWTALLPPVIKVLFIAFSQMQSDGETLSRTFAASLAAVCVVAVPVFLGLSGTAETAVYVLFGPSWSESAVLIQVMALAGLPMTVTLMSGTLLLATGRARTYLAIELTTAVAGAVALVAVSPFGLVWIALALVAREVAAIALHAAAQPSSLSARHGWGRLMLACIGLSMTMYAGLRAFEPTLAGALSPASVLIVMILASIVFYAAGMLVLARGPLRRALNAMSELRLR